MVECETQYRPPDHRKISYVGTLAELEKALDLTRSRLQHDPKFPILLDHLRAGRYDEGWEEFEHAFAIVKELEQAIIRNPNTLELFPPTEDSELDFRLEVQGHWVYFEVKASPMFSFEGEFLHAGLEKRISKKIQQELDPNLFYIICFTDLKPDRLGADDFYEYLKTTTEGILKSRNQRFPVLLEFPESHPAVEVLVVHRKKLLERPPLSSNESWAITLQVIRFSLECSGGRNHFFSHFAPPGYDLKRRLQNLLGHAADQMDEDKPNVLVLYTREVVLGSLDEVYENCRTLFTENEYFIIDAVAINVEDIHHNLRRTLFERERSKLPISIDSLL